MCSTLRPVHIQRIFHAIFSHYINGCIFRVISFLAVFAGQKSLKMGSGNISQNLLSNEKINIVFAELIIIPEQIIVIS